jgi:kynurenine formamidase
VPPGYEAVDPRTARRVALWQELGPGTPIFEGDPPFSFEVFTTIPESGYLLERITSLGTHTGTHISVPAHFIEGGARLGELAEDWTLMPLVVLDVRDVSGRDGSRLDGSGLDGSGGPAVGGGTVVGVNRLLAFEQRYGRIPAGGCVLLLTGFAGRPAGERHGPTPGFDPAAVKWLFESRAVRAIGSDTFGPDASGDATYPATATALQLGGITVENVGVGLAQMRPFGDWVSVNGPRPGFSGFQVGITGFTLP